MLWLRSSCDFMQSCMSVFRISLLLLLTIRAFALIPCKMWILLLFNGYQQGVLKMPMTEIADNKD